MQRKKNPENVLLTITNSRCMWWRCWFYLFASINWDNLCWICCCCRFFFFRHTKRWIVTTNCEIQILISFSKTQTRHCLVRFFFRSFLSSICDAMPHGIWTRISSIYWIHTRAHTYTHPSEWCIQHILMCCRFIVCTMRNTHTLTRCGTISKPSSSTLVWRQKQTKTR